MLSPKRLIEVDLPIGKISAQARREKSIRHGHISTLHIWWARRPLAACRAVLLASLLPDPADENCPPAFRESCQKHLSGFAHAVRTKRDLRELLKNNEGTKWVRRNETVLKPDNPGCWFEMRQALLDFVGDSAAWEMSTRPEMLACARGLVAAAHEALGGEPGTKPLVVDPFAGGGAIPLEALRLGCDAFAMDCNPVAALLLKVVLEYIPRYGEGLADAVREWGGWVKERAEEELASFYPKDSDGSVPIAYLWARTVKCEGPGCGAEVPLLRQLWLARKGKKSVALRMVPRPRLKRVDFEIVEGVRERDVGQGTVKRGSATCPVCGFTTPVARVREQLRACGGGTKDARLFAVVTTKPGGQGRRYRTPTDDDLKVIGLAKEELERREKDYTGTFSLVPDEGLPPEGTLGFRVQSYGILKWGDLFTSRQALALTTFVRFVREAHGEILRKTGDAEFARAVATALGISVDRQADRLSSLARYDVSRDNIANTFALLALPIVWDFAEANPFSGATGGWDGAVEWVEKVARHGAGSELSPGVARMADATTSPIEGIGAPVLFTDPPYYDAVPYADLSDFFYVWLKRSVGDLHPDLFEGRLSPKPGEIVVNPTARADSRVKDHAFFEEKMTEAFRACRGVIREDGFVSVVFAHKTTAGWSAILKALTEGGWTVTASWPLDTEMGTRLRARASAALASSVHVILRPRSHDAGTGDWRDVSDELGTRVREWMRKLDREGIVGADALFACIGPGMEVFSRFERVEWTSGEKVELPEFLKHLWEVVAREALGLFEEADASGFEEDSRLTAVWLWTVRPKVAPGNGTKQEEMEEKEEETGGKAAPKGFGMPYDDARLLIQGIGADEASLKQPGGVLEVKGETARLLAASERSRFLLGDGGRETGQRGRRRLKELFQEEEAPDIGGHVKAGETTLDRLHQAMLLFGLNRQGALRRLLTEDGAGSPGFWRLADTLSKLYPLKSEEKRWLDGVLGMKRGLGF